MVYLLIMVTVQETEPLLSRASMIRTGNIGGRGLVFVELKVLTVVMELLIVQLKTISVEEVIM